MHRRIARIVRGGTRWNAAASARRCGRRRGAGCVRSDRSGVRRTGARSPAAPSLPGVRAA